MQIKFLLFYSSYCYWYAFLKIWRNSLWFNFLLHSFISYLHTDVLTFYFIFLLKMYLVLTWVTFRGSYMRQDWDGEWDISPEWDPSRVVHFALWTQILYIRINSSYPGGMSTKRRWDFTEVKWFFSK